MTIKNFTPHPVVIVDGERVVRRIESSGQIRLAVRVVAAEPIDGIPTSSSVFGEPVGLPSFISGTWLIVSQIVKSALPDRADLLVPAESGRS